MPFLAVIFGLLLVVLGVAGWDTTGMQHPTALIPAAFGVALVLLGFLARDQKFRKHAMHLAAALALLGVVMPLIHLIPTAIKGKATAAAALTQTLMVLLCAAFLGLCVRSFKAARRRRAAEAK